MIFQLLLLSLPAFPKLLGSLQRSLIFNLGPLCLDLAGLFYGPDALPAAQPSPFIRAWDRHRVWQASPSCGWIFWFGALGFYAADALPVRQHCIFHGLVTVTYLGWLAPQVAA